jgi:hypothetical protein
LQIELKFIKLISSSFQLKGLTDTIEYEQEQGHGFTVVKLNVTSAMKNVCFTRKTRTQQSTNPNEVVAMN